MDLHDLDILALASLLGRRRVSPREVLQTALDRIERLNPSLNAFLSLRAGAMRDAIAAERVLRAGRSRSPLCGIPISVKDIVLAKDEPTTAGSRCFGDGLVSDTDAPVIRGLRRAGAIIVGRTNLHELALGVTTVNEHFGPARNPWDIQRVSGGSSGGSAVAVAARMGAASVGTDTRGSIRIPAACCGIVGLKPTRGLVSTAGVIPLSPTLDHVGPMTRSVVDAAAMLGPMTGRARMSGVWLRACGRGVRRLRVGVSEYHLRDLDSEVQRRIDSALTVVRRLGVVLVDAPLPAVDDVQQASVVITAAEAVAYHDRILQSDPGAFGPLVRQRLEGGYRWRALDYVRAMNVRARFKAEIATCFRSVDVAIGATLPALPPRIDEHAVHINGQPANTVDAFSRLNSPQNMAGIPAMSIPAGLSASGLPVGLQLIAGHGREDLLFALGAAVQRESDWHLRMPRME
ncbi:MAG: Glutamyl-tRNA(Gln) amidotransferase subunit A [Gemmatimonadaceae bacterium]|nr:Glutamyl-tRNA(Gln) amidotransferase subunit A [Gemmatimonadaceae bacterium]